MLTLLAIFSHLLIQATCINYYTCTQRCNVRARTHEGWVCGRLRRAEDGTPYASFRGIPYGKPPLGARRFQELEPVEPWGDTLLDATADAPACPQTDLIRGRMPMQIKGMSEDCMYLNIHVPKKWLPEHQKINNYRGRGLPMLVFIHGGSLQSGAGLTDDLGPEYLMTRDVICITFNYRLHAFGFLSLNTKQIPGNQGFRDQLSVLRWVRRNARAFGGDPNNVTLMGQSAGATSAQILSLSKPAQGLFQKIILTSCTAFPSYFTTSAKYAKEVSTMFLEQLGINQTDPVLIHQELIKMPLLKIMHANSFVLYNKAVVTFNPVVESQFPGVTRILEDDPLTLMAQGRGREYPAIVSFTNNEMGFGRWLVYEENILPKLSMNPSGIVPARLAYTLPETEIKRIAAKIYKRYFKEAPTVDTLMKCFNNMFFEYPAFKVAEWRALTGGAPMYLYKFSYELAFSVMKQARWLDYRGAAHLDDLYCIFRVNSLLGDYTSYPPKTSDDYMKYWMVHIVTNFMTCGAPICHNTSWPSVTDGKVQYNLIDEPMRVKMRSVSPEELNMVQFFDSFDPKIRNITFITGKE